MLAGSPTKLTLRDMVQMGGGKRTEAVSDCGCIDGLHLVYTAYSRAYVLMPVHINVDPKALSGEVHEVWTHALSPRGSNPIEE